MRHRLMWAAGAVVAAVVIGCGPGKELPDENPSSKGTARNNETKEGRPTTSDPAAVKIVERAINAHTQHNPILLEKAKISKVTAKGTIKLGGDQATPASRSLLARWPDEMKWSYVSLSPTPENMTYILRHAVTWGGKNGAQLPNINPQRLEQDIRAGGLAEHWLVLLFPLAERGAVIYDLRKGLGVGTPRADVVSVLIPGRPIFRLHFAPDTGLLTQVDYRYTDMVGPAFNEWILSDYKKYSGLLLPSQMKKARTPEPTKFRDIVEEWTVENWEFPDKLEEGSFDPPK